MILCLLEIIFSECLHNQKPAITFVLSSYLLKAPVSEEPSLAIPLPPICALAGKDTSLKLKNGRSTNKKTQLKIAVSQLHIFFIGYGLLKRAVFSKMALIFYQRNFPVQLSFTFFIPSGFPA